MLFLLIDQSPDSVFNLFATIADLLHTLSPFTRFISWVNSLSAGPDFSLDISTAWTDIFHISAIPSRKLLTWKSQFSLIPANWPWDFSWYFFLNLLLDLFWRFFLKAILSTSPTIINGVIWFDSSSDIVHWVIPLHFRNNSDIILPLRARLNFLLRLIWTHEPIFQGLGTVLSHLRRCYHLWYLWVKVVCGVCPSELSLWLSLFLLIFILGSWESFFDTFQVFGNHNCLEKAGFAGLTVVVLSTDFISRHISLSGNMVQKFKRRDSLSG